MCPLWRGTGNLINSEFGDPLSPLGRTSLPFESQFLRLGWLCQTGWQESKESGRMPLVAWKPTRNCCHGRQRWRGCLGDPREGLVGAHCGRQAGAQGTAVSPGGLLRVRMGGVW